MNGKTFTWSTGHSETNGLMVVVFKFEQTNQSCVYSAVPLPLRVETRRYSGLCVYERTCNICNSNETEDEIHFWFKCPCYYDLRLSLINKATETKANFLLLNDVEKLRHVVENHFIYCCKIYC